MSAVAERRERYPDVTPQPKYPQIEEKILTIWQERNTFRRSVEMNPTGERGTNEYVFYDGPPFANGLPHYGHLLTGFIKDIVPRYHTMRGKRVERRFGWDCHGLPAELDAEKGLKISGRQQITQYGIDNFNQYCQTSVLRYTKEWERYVTRQARWVDFSNDYKTMDISYMESVMWAFKTLWQKGLVYEGFRVMPYSWACETPLSNFETRMDNSYRERQDPALTVALSATETSSGKDLKFLIWTTTPWTLPSNLAAAVGSEIEYSIIELHDVRYVLASAAIQRYEKELSGHRLVGTLKGTDLVGKTYQPLFPYFANTPNAFRVLAGDFVSTDDGTGIVHMAPGFGEDDQIVCSANNIPTLCPVDDSGKFTAEVADYVGQQVLDANKNIIKDLKARGVVLRHETYLHNYPHCWRTDTPIIYKALSSWYVKVSAFKDRMVELNQQIRWIPEHIKDGQFGRWLENARDWSISRNRFWGAPIPLWKSDDPRYPRIDVYGSLDELERDFGVRPSNLHRPYIDQLTRPNPDDPTGNSTMRRVEEVLDCWFESGSMPFAQVHYPFENREWFESHFPADFIVEYVAQTRGWFYTLMVLGTALFDRPPFKNCLCHGVVLDENGQKLSKRLKNYPSPEEVCNTYGADALRWFLMSSSIVRGADLMIDREGKAIGEIVRTVLNPIWNAYYFFTLYANSDGIQASFDTSSKIGIDRYILSKTHDLILSVQERLDNYDLPGACHTIVEFLDSLNNWYIRRSRERFWKSVHDTDKTNAYNTLYSVLVTLCKVSAPLLPLILEEVYRGLTGEESVHLTHWPDAAMFPSDPTLVREMDKVREICSAALSVRETNSLRTRLPLRSLTVAGDGLDALKPYTDIIAEELNVKRVDFTPTFEEFGSFQLQVNPRELGPKLGESMKNVLAATRSGQWSLNTDQTVTIAGHTLGPKEYTLKLKLKEGIAGEALPANDALVVLDIKVTQDLYEEGLARDLVRAVQQARKNADLHIADTILLALQSSDQNIAVFKAYQSYISEQVLATEISYTVAAKEWHSENAVVGDSEVQISLTRAG
jgi:isoleucyl-tRNA synthetase